MKGIIGLFLVFSIAGYAAESESFGVFAPYVGTISNAYSNPAYKLNLEGSGVMTGGYAQWIQPEDFQANAFVYYVPQAGMSDVFGLHVNGDYYPAHFSFGKLVTGLDFEWVNIRTEGAVPGLESLEVRNKVAMFMPRAGVSVSLLKENNVSVSLFPYVGATYEKVSGSVSVNPQGPAPLMTVPIDSDATYAAARLNLNLNLMHFIDVQGKYLTGFKTNARWDSVSVLFNVYMSRSLAVSYRYKTMKYSNTTDQYHLVGIATII